MPVDTVTATSGAPGPGSAGRSSATRLDPAAIRAALREAGLRARRGLSQNFLADVEVLERIVDAATPAPSMSILEIGPGLGVLTGALLDAGASVVAVELDEGLVERLRKRFRAQLRLGESTPGAGGALRLIQGDALDVDVAALLEPPYDIVANLPDHITSPILHHMLGEWPRPGRAVLMLQREVAERIAARPGAMSYLSVFVQYHAHVEVLFIVPPAAFEPEPAVESAVVLVEPYDPASTERPMASAEGSPASAEGSPTSAEGSMAAVGSPVDGSSAAPTAVPSLADGSWAAPTAAQWPAAVASAADVGSPERGARRPARRSPDRPTGVVRLAPADEATLWRVVQAAFRERRKMVHNVLVRQLGLPPDRVGTALRMAGIAPDRRPQTLSVADWIRLLDALGPIGPDERGRRHTAATARMQEAEEAR